MLALKFCYTQIKLFVTRNFLETFLSSITISITMVNSFQYDEIRLQCVIFVFIFSHISFSLSMSAICVMHMCACKFVCVYVFVVFFYVFLFVTSQTQFTYFTHININPNSIDFIHLFFVIFPISYRISYGILFIICRK